MNSTNSLTYEKLVRQAEQFLKKVTLNIGVHNIDLGTWEIDHLCYRTPSFERYVELKEFFYEFGSFLGEAMIGGRPISTFKFFRPIPFEKKWIPLIELPAPKNGVPTLEGFEHIEAVIDCEFQDLMQKYPGLIFKTGGLSKEINKEIELVLDGFSIKFHHQSLESVIQFENQQKTDLA